MKSRQLIVPFNSCDCDEDSGSDSVGEAAVQHLINMRTIVIFRSIDDALAKSVIAQLMVLETVNRQKDITMLINCPGGTVTASLAIYDAMQKTVPDIATIGIGRSYSGGALLLVAGTKGKRRMLPNASLMIHKIRGGIAGDHADMTIEKALLDREQELLTSILAKHTGQTVDKLEELTDRNLYLTAEQSLEFGAIDLVDREKGWYPPPEPKPKRPKKGREKKDGVAAETPEAKKP